MASKLFFIYNWMKNNYLPADSVGGSVLNWKVLYSYLFDNDYNVNCSWNSKPHFEKYFLRYKILSVSFFRKNCILNTFNMNKYAVNKFTRKTYHFPPEKFYFFEFGPARVILFFELQSDQKKRERSRNLWLKSALVRKYIIFFRFWWKKMI